MARYLIQSVNKATTGRGKPYLRLRLFEPGGRAWPAVFWEDKELTAGVLIDALTEESTFGGEAQLTVKALRVLNEKPGEEFLPHTEHSVDGLLTELRTFVGSVRHPALRALLEKATVDERWRRAPAAMKMHHAYLGGLLEHVVSMCRLADAIVKLYPELDRDLLLTGVVLHDLGKMDEMDCGINIEYTSEGELLGHIVIGLLRADRWMDKDVVAFGTSEAPSPLRLTVRHLIISHHGSPQYGSPKAPATLEAQVLSAVDGIDAAIAKMRAAVKRTPPGSEWSDKVDFNQRLWLKKITEERS